MAQPVCSANDQYCFLPRPLKATFTSSTNTRFLEGKCFSSHASKVFGWFSTSSFATPTFAPSEKYFWLRTTKLFHRGMPTEVEAVERLRRRRWHWSTNAVRDELVSTGRARWSFETLLVEPTSGKPEHWNYRSLDVISLVSTANEANDGLSRPIST